MRLPIPWASSGSAWRWASVLYFLSDIGARTFWSFNARWQPIQCPLHAARLAKELDIKRILVPRNPGILCAMGLLQVDSSGRLSPTEQGRHLISAIIPNLVDYVGLEANDPGVIETVQRLKHDGPIRGAEELAYVMEKEMRSLSTASRGWWLGRPCLRGLCPLSEPSCRP